MKRTLDRTVVSGLTLVVLLIAGNVFLAYRNAQRVEGTARAVTHAQDVLTALDRIMLSVREAETGQRGYVLTTDERYLAPLNDADKRVAAEVERLHELTRDNASLNARVPELRQIVTDRMNLLNQGVSLMQKYGADSAVKLIRSDRGRLLMEAISNMIDEMADHERRALAEEAGVYEQSRKFALGTTIAGGAIALVILLAFAFALSRTLRARDDAALALLEQKELFRTTLASIGDAVIATDLDGKVVFINGMASALTGWNPNEAGGASIGDVFRIVREESRQTVENPALRALRTQDVVASEDHTVMLAKDGRETPVDNSAAPIRDGRGKVGGAVLVFRDITERRSAERRLREGDRAKDEFLAILSHELRNPLAPLRNALELAESSSFEEPERKQIVSMMTRQVDQLVRLTDDLLDVSRITRNKLQMHRHPVDLVRVAREAIETSGPLLLKEGHTLYESMPPKPVIVMGDRARLVQVLYNLIGNAAKYTEPGGTISVSVSSTGTDARVSVKDNGVGIAPEMQDRIFELFTQVDRSLERAQGGLGIGLTLAKRIVERHDGTITVQSARGEGSEFIITLPLHVPEAATTTPIEAPKPVPRRAASKKILVTDDNRDAADTTSMLLRALGHEVITAYDGKQAVEAAGTFRPQLMLVDIGMPEMNGYDVARAIRATPWGPDVMLVALTGWGQPEDRARSAAAGFDKHLVKPVEMRELAAVLEMPQKAPA